MEREAGVVGQRDASEREMHPVVDEQPEQVVVQPPPEALPLRRGRQVDRDLSGVPIAELGAVRRRAGVAHDPAVDLGHQQVIARRPAFQPPLPDRERSRLGVERRVAGAHLVVVDGGDVGEVGVPGCSDRHADRMTQ